MVKLTKRIQELPEIKKPPERCIICQHLILRSKDNEDLWWCPVCEDWTIPIERIEGDKIRKKMYVALNTFGMRRKMDKNLIELKKKLDSRVKIYTSEGYSQEFLNLLIPKR